MDQASSVRETAAFVRRVALRALTVVGGAAAGTAIAWCLSTGTAAADTGVFDPVQDPSQDRHQVLAQVVAPVGDALDQVATRLSDPPPPPRNPNEDVGEKLKEATDRFTDRAGHVDVLPACAADCAGDRTEAATGLDRTDQPTAAPPVTPPTPVPGGVTGPGADPGHTAERTATDRTLADGLSRRGSPAPAVPAVPDLPTPPAPFPPTAPAPGHAGNAGAHPADSTPFAVLPWQNGTTGPVRGLIAPATAAAFGRVGDQPGVAPD